jgi:two-component system alkaline phosphatase synthesis response regulator PhoP
MKLIYCVEDDYITREFLICALKTVNYEVSGFLDNQLFMEKLNNLVPDLILLNTVIEGEDGISILHNLKVDARYKNIPVIMLSETTSEEIIVKCLNLGADDFIKKPFSVLELIARVNAVLRCSKLTDIEKDQVEVNGIVLDYKRRKVRYENNYVDLNYNEFELFNCLIRNNGLVLSKDKIINEIWGSRDKKNKRTLNMYVRAIRRKFEDVGYHNIIKTVRSAGFKIEENL